MIIPQWDNERSYRDKEIFLLNINLSFLFLFHIHSTILGGKEIYYRKISSIVTLIRRRESPFPLYIFPSFLISS